MLSRALATAALGAAAALPISCSGSGSGLIPSGNAGPLQRDFAAVAEAAQKGNGSCSGTETAIARTEQDYRALPAAVDQGLRGRLREGIEKLREDALQLCLQPLAQTTATSTSAPETTTAAPAVPETTPTQTSPTTSTSTTPENGGGTPAPGAGGEQPSEGDGAGAGGAGEGNGGGKDGKGGGKDGNGGPGGARPEGGK